jgi:hypothetical protein
MTRIHCSFDGRAAALAVVGLGVACGSVPDDPGGRVFPAQGVVRGTVVYQGPRPCTRAGHVVGGALLLVFDRRNPPPPNGLAANAVNFADVTGDVLFADEPRYTGPEAYCPLQSGFTETIKASAPFEIAPLAGGSYEIRAFFDYTGNFLPEFTIRNLPEQGDIAGGDVDTTDAIQAMNIGNPNYEPRFLPVDIGVAQPPGPTATPETIPEYVIPDRGFVADNVTVTIGAPLRTARPYFYAQGTQVAFDLANPTALASSVTQSSDVPATDSRGIEASVEVDPNSMPILTIPQDIAVLAPPTTMSPASALFFESTFPHLRLGWGVPAGEAAKATEQPFGLQIAPFGQGPQGAGFSIWQNATLDPTAQRYRPQEIPEGGGVPELWPAVILTKLVDPAANPGAPVVLMQGIPILGGAPFDSLLGTAASARNDGLFDVSNASGPRPFIFAQDHLTVVLRPSVICFPSPLEPGMLVTPHPTATSADLDCSSIPCVPNGAPDQLIAPPESLKKLTRGVNSTQTGCLPTGRYAIHVIYPNGQAWTVPNESGACSESEGVTDYSQRTCSRKPRPVLYSQGTRAVVEVVAARDAAYCLANPVPSACTRSP